MHIAVDMDDVVVDFTNYVLECIKREYGVEIPVLEITDWDDNPLKNATLFGPGKTWWDWLMTRDWLWAKCPAVEGAIGGLQTLRDMGHRLELLTSKPLWAEWVVWAWAGKWRPPVHGITIADHTAKQAKHDLTDALLLVDDAIHNVAPWTATGRSAILFDRPWNRNLPADQIGRVPRRIFRAHDWAGVVRLVKEMS